MTLSAIPSLYKWSCPAAISRLVVSVIVLAFDGNPATRRLGSHVTDEVAEFLPSVTDPNSSRSIVLKLFASRIAASLLHHHPGVVFRTAFPAVLRFRSCCHFLAKASAAARVAATQILPDDGHLGATIAFANPLRLTVRAIFGPRSDDQSSKSSAYHFLKVVT
jgi:hypothetical protein